MLNTYKGNHINKEINSGRKNLHFDLQQIHFFSKVPSIIIKSHYIQSSFDYDIDKNNNT
jgi:hypothetical protein